MAAPKEIGRKPNGMGECRPLCGCVMTTSWKYMSYMNFFLQNNVTIVTAQDSYLIISCLRVTLEAFSNVT